jgi:glycosyltransferase involved in cell wall biosynthesis
MAKKKTTDNLKDVFVSAVVVANDSMDSLVEYIEELSETLRTHYTNYEIIIVDNGLVEEASIIMSEVLLNLPCIRIIRLARRFDQDTALFAGLEVSIGDFVCTLDPVTDPVKLVPNLVKLSSKKDVIQGVSESPLAGPITGKLGRRVFYWYNRKYLGIDIPVNATYFASYSRRAVNSLTRSTRSRRHIRHLARRVGYSYDIASYVPLAQVNRHRKLKTGIFEALEIAISYSSHPLRFVTWLGLSASVVNLLYAIYVVVVNIFDKNVVEGWTTTSLQSSVMFFILFIMFVIISEYIGKILTESYKDPHYYITDELTSSVSLADAKRRNITK